MRQNAFLCYNWNMANSSENTFSLEMLIIIFNGHVLDTIGQSITYSFATHIMLDVVKAKPKPMLHVVGRREPPLRLVVCWSRGAMFASSHFGIAQSG